MPSPPAHPSDRFRLRPAIWVNPGLGQDPDISTTSTISAAGFDTDDPELQEAFRTVNRLSIRPQSLPASPVSARRDLPSGTRAYTVPASPASESLGSFPSLFPVLQQLPPLIEHWASRAMAQPYRLPPRGASGAPTFDPTHLQTLLDFFEDLDYMLGEANIADGEQCKAHAVRYAPTTEKILWRTFEGFKVGQTFEAFKRDVIKEYLGEDGKRLYSLGDLRALVSDAAKATFRTTSDFKLYSRQFRVVADYLVEHEVLRKDERDRLFLKGLSEVLAQPVLDRLRYKAPDVLAPRIPYSVEQVTEAAEFVLDSFDEDAPSLSTAAPTTVRPELTGGSAPHIKTESMELAGALKAMAQAVALLHCQVPTAGNPVPRQTPPHLDPTAPRTATCHYCGDAAHIIRRCPQVDADMTAGLVKRNEQGQVVLQAGNYVPSTVTGTTLRDRVQEYYRQHPDARPPPRETQMLFELVVRHIVPAPTQSAVQYLATDAIEHPAVTTTRGILHNLAHDETGGAFAQLEQEIFAAEQWKGKWAQGAADRAERARRRSVRFEEPDEGHNRAVVVPPPAANIEELPDEPTIRTVNPASKPSRAPAIPSALPSAPTTGPALAPEHPFRNVPDATYAPPTERNFGLPPPAPAKVTAPMRKNEAAYKSLVPVYDPSHAVSVFQRCLDTQVSLTQAELLSLAPEIRNATRETCPSRLNARQQP
ncbi:hypothetical protein C8Q78DRAFT_993112 [Trametes maxima]|nr:hypothetical protein C8Q78DRAFT_993112 [Trametes maxima]